MTRKDITPDTPPDERLRVFALHGSDTLGKAVCSALGVAPAAHEERNFEDGEHKTRSLATVAGCDVYVLHSLHGTEHTSGNDRLCRLLFFIGALKDAGAARVTAVAPYLCYGRKDRRTKAHDPVITRYLAALFEAVGTDGIVTLEPHNDAAYENAFRCRTTALTAMPLFVDHVRALPDEPWCVVSPDAGGTKRAEAFRQQLEVALGRPIGNAFAEKYRSSDTVSGNLFVGDVKGATALLIDDMISTGGTLLRAAQAARRAGARRVLALATHGLFSADAASVLADPAIDRIFITDTVTELRLPPGPARDKIDVISAAPLLAETISRLHRHRSLEDLQVY